MALRTNPEIPSDEIERFVDNVDHIRPARIELEEAAGLHRRPTVAFRAVHVVPAAISIGFGLILSRLGIQRVKG